MKIITKHEFSNFEYQITRIFQNPCIKNYFYNLYHFSIKVNSHISFPNLFEYGKKQKLLEELFWDKDAWRKSKKYCHYLNF